MPRDPDFKLALLVALVGHIVVIGLLVFGYNFREITPTAGEGPVINAKIIDTRPLIEKKKQQKIAEQKRLEEQARKKREEEQRKIREAEAEKQRIAEAERKQREQEQERQRQAEAEKKRIAEAERKQKEDEARKAAEAEKKRVAEEERKKQEAEEQRKREEAERKKREEEERKRKEEEARKKKEAEEKARREQEEAERKRLEEELFGEIDEAAEDLELARAKGVANEFAAQIQRKVRGNWIQPTHTGRAEIRIQVGPGGVVLAILDCQGDNAYCSTGIAAIKRSEPLPVPDDPKALEQLKNLRIILDPTQQ